MGVLYYIPLTFFVEGFIMSTYHIVRKKTMDKEKKKDELDQLTTEVMNAMIEKNDCDVYSEEEDRERCKSGKFPYDPNGYTNQKPKVYDEFNDPYGGY